MDWWNWVLITAGGIVAIGGAVAMIIKAIRPVAGLLDRVKSLERHEKQDLNRFEKIEIALLSKDKADQAILKALHAMLGHQIDGNGIDKLKDARTRLWEHIIEMGVAHEKD